MSQPLDLGELSLVDALDLAVLIEGEARERYAELSDQMTLHHNEDAARFFARMVEVERVHESALAGRREQRFPWEQRKVTRAMIFDVEAPGYESARATMTVRSAMAMALEAEAKARDFYDEALRRVTDPEARTLFTELRHEETEHMGLVEREIAKLPPESVVTAEDYADDPVAQ